MSFYRQARKNRLMDLPGKNESLLCLGSEGLVRLSRIPELPRIFGERRRAPKKRFQFGIYLHAMPSDFYQVMGFPERLVVPD